MRSRFHHDKGSLLEAFQFICRHQGPFGHLQALRRIVLAPADRAGQHRSGTEGLGDDLSRFAGRRETTCDRKLAVILNNGRSFLSVILDKLLIGLDDTHQTQPSATAG